MNNRRGKEKLVVEVAAAHNLMPKDGEGSSSAFVEVKFENQTRRTQVKHGDLNPVWNEKLVFCLNDVAGLPYRTVEVNVFNERRSNSTRNFLGRVWVSGSTIAREGEAAAQIFTLEKRTVFSHVRGEISLKLYISTLEKEEEEEVKQVINAGAGGAAVATPKSKKNKKVQGKNMVLQVHQENKQNPAKQVEPSQPVVVTAVPGAAVCGGAMVGPYSAAGRNTTSPQLPGGLTLKLDKTSSTYDLVEQMQYLYMKVVKARFDFAGGELVAEVKLGNYRGITKKASAIHPEWDQVFAFSKDSIQSSFVELYVREINRDDFIGRVWFDLNEIPRRVPPDSQLAPQWYRMEDKTGDKSKAGEVMVSAWFGTQADEAFAEAWHSKSANVALDGLSSIKSKVYLSPKLWYLRVGVLEAQDIVVSSCDKGSSLLRYPDLFVKVQVGNQVLRTRVSKTVSTPLWNEDLMFVVGEPFEDLVFVSVEDRVSPNKDEVVGRLVLPVSGIERRANEKPVAPRWFNLDTNFNNSSGFLKSVRFAPRIHLRASLDGGYHVLDESTVYSSDLRPTAKQLWKPRVGVLEVGFLGASNLVPMKMKQGTRGSTDSYCVAKYGQKWIRTRTVVDSLAPKWNEQYTWDVFDPWTVITIAVFDNSRVLTSAGTIPDPRIGKIRIRLSTLETDRVYTLTYPLLMLYPSGVKKMGELNLAVRFSCDNNNMLNMLHMYTMPLLPKMHYVQPLTVSQLDGLRYQAMNVVAGRLSRAEPPLGREVVEYMLDHDSQMWSMRKSKANFFRLTNVLTGAVNMCRLFESVRNWDKPVYSTGFLIAFFVVVVIPELVIPCVFLAMAVVGLWQYRWRPRTPPRMDTRLSCTENVQPDELDEEFDFFSSARSPEVVRLRYDRLRSVAGRIQTVVGDMATQAERFQALLSWRDPRATFLFVVFCFLAALGFYMVPFRLVVAVWGVYVLRPPKFRNRLPSCAVSFFKRLPTRADSLL